MNKWNDRLLLINLYGTQGLVLVVAILILAFQGTNPLRLLAWPAGLQFLLWAGGFAALVLAAERLIARWVPESVMDDGGVNEQLFARRSVWHILLLCVLIGVCEELLFRGAVQQAWGPYWTSILFTGIHIRYLRHWLPTGMVFAISYGLGLLYDATGTLWAPIMAHMAIDAVQAFNLRFGSVRK